MGDDLRQRYAMAANLAQEEWRGDELLCERIADYVLAVRDTELETARASISRARALHRIHSCEVDGHKLDRTPTPCVNNGICRCGQRDPCPTLAALDREDT